jgi:two-component system cell cycle response regulator
MSQLLVEFPVGDQLKKTMPLVECVEILANPQMSPSEHVKNMSARVLVVDDNAANRRLLEARLNSEYFDVLTASNGPEALAICETTQCDIVLLDVMMPEMDGFEVCGRLRSNPATSHLPVVMVTALDQPSDLVRGLEAGADDFVTKPIDEVHLIARVRSLARLKVVIDELRSRTDASACSGINTLFSNHRKQEGRCGRLLLVDDRKSSSERLVQALAAHHTVEIAPIAQEALLKAAEGAFDLIVVSLGLENFDALRLCGQIRAMERTRHLPILLIADPDDRTRILRGLEIGISDWLSRPVDRNELLARVRTQLRHKRYADSLREEVRESLELALYDPLTGLNNRRFLESHLSALIDSARLEDQPLTMMIVDIDHFKRVNDTYGHDAGDEVLKAFSQRLRGVIRKGDLLCRLGGEEFVMVMPGANSVDAVGIAERARVAVARDNFAVGASDRLIPVTASIGVAALGVGENWRELYHCADQALYRAKAEGRNRVTVSA